MIVFVPVMFWATALLACLAYVVSGDVRHARARTRRGSSTVLPDLREAALREYPEFSGMPEPPAPASGTRDGYCRVCALPAYARGMCLSCYRQAKITSRDIHAIAGRPR
jgi:hypothetical protein